MSKTIFFVKYLKNIINFINNLLEKNLNKLNFKNLSNLFKNNKLILIFVALFVIFTSYLLLPTFYKHSEITKKLKSDLKSKFDINFKFSQNIKYNFFPRPYFTTEEANIFDGKNEISKINKLKIFISFENLFSLKNIKVKDIIFENANFNINKENYNFFLNLLDSDLKDGNLTMKNSNIFFRNSNDEVLFINKIHKMKYFYEPKELKNIIYSSNETFNIPFSTEIFFNKDKSKIFSQINLDILKLKIKNETSLNSKKKIGKSEFIINKLKHVVSYQIRNNYFEFDIFDKLDEPNINYKGKFNFKPFYASLDGNLKQINFSYLFGPNAIISQLLKTEILNNKNIDFKLIINADNIYKNVNFKNIILKSKIQEGLIDTDSTKFEWKNFADFELYESLIYVKNGELVLDGRLKIFINDYNGIYKFLLTPKNYRNKIEKIDLNFNYNFDRNIAQLKDIKIDNKINQSVNTILNNVFLKKNNFQNKIYLKNLLNEALKSYAG